jgi:hypothetical protein
MIISMVNLKGCGSLGVSEVLSQNLFGSTEENHDNLSEGL